MSTVDKIQIRLLRSLINTFAKERKRLKAELTNAKRRIAELENERAISRRQSGED